MPTVRRTRRTVQRVVDSGADAGSAGTTKNINVAEPSNVVISGNVGEGDTFHAADTRQRVRIRQDGDESYEETESTETRI